MKEVPELLRLAGMPHDKRQDEFFKARDNFVEKLKRILNDPDQFILVCDQEGNRTPWRKVRKKTVEINGTLICVKVESILNAQGEYAGLYFVQIYHDLDKKEERLFKSLTVSKGVCPSGYPVKEFSFPKSHFYGEYLADAISLEPWEEILNYLEK